MNRIFFVGSLYVGAFLAVVVAISGMLMGVSPMTMALRIALTLVVFAFLGWLAETILAQAAAPAETDREDAGARGATIDVVLPATGEE
jgi:hypothetical protein